MSQIYGKSGGYRKLHSFNIACIIHLGTMHFCRNFIDWKEDRLGKTIGQMVGASRSGKQNIIEGSERAGTSMETEIKLLDVARASLAELQGDFEDYLVAAGHVPWSVRSEDHKALSAIKLDLFEYTDDVLHDHWTYLLNQKKMFSPWLEHQDGTVVANGLLVLVQRARGLLARQMKALEASFVSNGGMRERMTKARVQARDEAHDEDAPQCPQCEQPMRKRNSQKGPFWGCSAFPDCRGSRAV